MMRIPAGRFGAALPVLALVGVAITWGITFTVVDDAAQHLSAADLVAFWQKQVDQATGLDKERKKSNLIAAQLAQKQLLEGSKSEDLGPTTIDFLKAGQEILKNFAGNLLPTGSTEALKAMIPSIGPVDFRRQKDQLKPPEVPLTPDEVPTGNELDRQRQAREREASIASEVTQPTGDAAVRSRNLADPSDVNLGDTLKVEQDQLTELKAIRQLLEGGVGTTVNVTQNMRTPDPSGFAQAKYARFAMEEAFNG